MKYIIRKCVSSNPHSFLFLNPWLLYMPNGPINYCFRSGDEAIDGLRRVLLGVSPFTQVSPGTNPGTKSGTNPLEGAINA